MATITAFEAKTRFGELLDRVSKGEEIVITRHERPVARIVPEGQRSIERVKAAVDELRAIRQEMSHRKGFKRLTDQELKSAIEAGRH